MYIICVYVCIPIYVYTYKYFSQKDLRGFVTTQEDYAKFTERQQNQLKNSVLLLYSFKCGGSKLRATGVCGQINTHYLAEVPSHSPLWTRILQPSFMSLEQRGNSGCVYGLKCPQWVVKDSRQKFCGLLPHHVKPSVFFLLAFDRRKSYLTQGSAHPVTEWSL